ATLAAKRRLYAREVPASLIEEAARRFADALEPLRESGRLGVVLLQYPVWFPASRRAHQEIDRMRGLLAGLRLAGEFRNWPWLPARNRDRPLPFLRERDLFFTCVAAPQGFPSSVPPLAACPSTLALVRFHGRNRASWNRRTPTAALRMD